MTIQPKHSIKEVLDMMVSAVLNNEEYTLNIGKLADNQTIVIDILVPANKVGVMLGRMDEFGKNPTKIAIARIMKQVIFYQGFSNLLLKIDVMKPEAAVVAK